MINEKSINSHYLSISYKAIVKNRIIHFIFFSIEFYYIFIVTLDIYSKDFKVYETGNNKISHLIFFIMIFNQLSMEVKFIIYFIIMIIAIGTYLILIFRRVKVNIIVKIFMNSTELIFYRLLSLFMFNYLYILTGVYLYINLILTVIYVFILFFNFYENHLYIFFPSLVDYPYDKFSMIIDIHALLIKIFLSLSTMSSNDNCSIFFFIISLCIFLVLLLYLSYILIYKSYYIMNNCSLNKIRYSIILAVCITILFVLIIDKKDLENNYYKLIYINIFLSCIFVCSFYDPYKLCKFDKDDNEENVFYYFFILDRNKNNFLLIEEKIQIHLSRCQRCNLCKKYNNLKLDKNDEIDLYHVISDGKNMMFNLMNNLLREIKRNGRSNFANNSYYLINIIYIYSLCIIRKDNNSKLNTELLFDIINFENDNILEEFNLCLNQIKYTNDFLIKAKNLVEYLNDILNEKKFIKIAEKIFNFGEKLKELKYREIKSNINNLSSHTNNIYGLPNCNNLLTISSLFYEEFFNEPFANSGIYIREGPNLLEDLINNNEKNSKQITLEINIHNFKTKIIRAGGHFNKYENNDLCNFFPLLFKSRQIIEMKNILLNSNDSFQMELLKEKYKNKKGKKEKQYIKFNFIIEEKEDNLIFYKILKLKLTLILITNINIIIYLNGTYKLDDNIIITEQKKDEEILLHCGNKEQIEYLKKIKNDKIIQKINNRKYFGNNKLVKDYNSFVGCKKYNVYHCIATISKNILYQKESQNKLNASLNNFEEEKTNMNDESNKFFLFNDIASQASSTTSSVSRNNLISYNRGNKQTQNDDEVPKLFIIFQMVLFLSLILFFIFLIFQTIYNSRIHKDLVEKNNFYLLIRGFKFNYDKLFFSILSLSCLAHSSDTKNCTQFMDELKKLAEEKIYQENQNSFLFLDFTELIFQQSQFIYDDLNKELTQIIKYLSYFKDNFIGNFKLNISHYKINQNFENNTLTLYLSKENLPFSDFLLLITSRFGIIMKNKEDLYNPIYILNKTGDNIFNNIYSKQKLNSYQLNMYLMILDYRAYSENFEEVIGSMGAHAYNIKDKLKKLLFITISLNLFLVIVIIASLILFVCIFFYLVFNVLKNINDKLEEKFNESTIKEILRKKLYNLKLLLSFYDNDINVPINDLNNIYNDYRENLNIKVKEEMKMNKKEGKNINEKKDKNYIEIFKVIRRYEILKISGRRNIYLYSLLFIIIASLIIIIFAFIRMIFVYKRDEIMMNCVELCEEVNSSTNRLMNNLLIMIYNNQTLDDISQSLQNKDYISYIFVKLGHLYEAGGMFSRVNTLDSTKTDQNIIFNCWLFYQTLENDLFEKLKNKYMNEQDKLFFTMFISCEWSKAMEFKNFKATYLQLYNNVEVIMENFVNLEYGNIISFFIEYEVIKIEIIYLITYIYFMDIMNQNALEFILEMMNSLGKNVINTSIIFFILLSFLLLIIFVIYIRNINNDCRKFLQIKKVFKICNLNE